MIIAFDPLIFLTIIIIQIANRYLKINITKAQEKIIMHPYMQFAMYFSIIYFTTRNIVYSLIIVLISYVFLNILFNENHKHNILSKVWLKEQNIISDIIYSQKEQYKNNINIYHQ